MKRLHLALVCVSAPWLASAAPSPQASARPSLVATAEDPVTGVWKGSAFGDGLLIPERGVPATLVLRRDEDSVTGRFTLQGFDPLTISGTFEPDSGALDIAANFRGAPLEIVCEIAANVLAGKISGMGMQVELEAKRISVNVLDQPTSPMAPVDVAQLAEDRWLDDLEFLGDYLPQVHANAFHTLAQEQWKAAIVELRERFPTLSALQKTVALAQLVARVGDAHTEFHWRELSGFASFPVQMQVFADGLFVTGVDERWADALALRVAEIGSVPAADALAAVSTLFAAENESWLRAKAPGLIAVPKLLAVLGIVESEDALPLVLETASGERLEVTIEASGDGRQVRAPDPEYDPVPRWHTRRAERYWSELLEDGSTVYFAYNSCSEDPSRPMLRFVADLLALLESAPADRLVIDLRNNSGGNSMVLGRHIERIGKHSQLAEPGSLLVLIGPSTYSSGMMNAHQLRAFAGATLLGEPTGGKPNSYGEVRSFRLPNSGLKVFYSTKYFQMLESDPPAVEPDVLVELRSDEHFGGQDPVLVRALDR